MALPSGGASSSGASLQRTMQQQRIRPKGVYAVLNGAASNYRFVKEFAEAANGVMDCNHWYDPRNPKAQELKKQVEAQGKVSVQHRIGGGELRFRFRTPAGRGAQ